MPRRIERERRARQAVPLGLIGARGEPAGERAEIGRTVAAAAAPFVDRRDRAEQLRDRRPHAGAQQLGLWRLLAAWQEPAAEAPPAFAPGLPAARLLVRHVLFATWRCIARFAFRDAQQQRIDARRQALQQAGDGIRAPHQIAHETFEVVDQPALVAHHQAGFSLLQLDAARHTGHEGLRVVGQALEDAHQVAQDLVGLGAVGPVAAGIGVDQVLQRQEPAGDIFQRDGLQLGAVLQSLKKDRQRGLDRFATDDKR